MPAPLCAALIDAPSNTLLTITTHTPILAFMVKHMTDVRPLWSLNYPNYVNEFKLGSAPIETYPEWMWNWETRLFTPNPPSNLTDRVRAASATAVKKSNALYEVMQAVTGMRHFVSTGVLLQETVNITKKIQARQFQADGYPEEDLLKYPFVLQVSEIDGVSMREATDEILFSGRLDDEILARSEALRLKYFKKIAEADLKSLLTIMAEFRGEIR